MVNFVILREVKAPMTSSQGSVKFQSGYLEYLSAFFPDYEYIGQFPPIVESILKTPKPLLHWLAPYNSVSFSQRNGHG